MSARRMIRIGLGAVTCITMMSASAAGVSAVAPSTPAAAGQGLVTLKQKCGQEVQNRTGVLNADASHINAATDLVAADRSALLGVDDSDEAGLTQLDGTIQADTTFAQAKRDCQRIVTDYHVYVLFEPQIHLIIAADELITVETKVSGLAQQLQQRLGGSAGGTAVRTALADLLKQVAAAQSSTSGVSSSVLALTPSGYPGNKPALQSALSAIQASRADLQHARTDIEAIRGALATATASPRPSA